MNGGNTNHRRLVNALAALTLMTVAPTSAQSGRIDIYRKVLNSTALISTNVEGELEAVSTGVLVDDERGLVITSLASINAVSIVTVSFPRFIDGNPIDDPVSYHAGVEQFGIGGRIVATDSVRDLALIELDSVPGDASAVRPSVRRSQPGEVFHALTNEPKANILWAFVSGRVRSVRSMDAGVRPAVERVNVVEVAVPLVPLSCGPAVNADGELVGFFGKVIRNQILDTFLDISEIRKFLEAATLP